MPYSFISRKEGAIIGWENGMAKIIAFNAKGKEAYPLNIITNIGIIAKAEMGKVKVWADL